MLTPVKVGKILDEPETRKEINENFFAAAQNRTVETDLDVLTLTEDYVPTIEPKFDANSAFSTFCQNNCADDELLVIPVNNA